MINKVTITGADDSVTPQMLIQLSQEYPFVEWGILVSFMRNGYARNRFPTKKWLEELREQIRLLKKVDSKTNWGLHQPQLSLHLCGKMVESTLKGSNDIKTLISEFPIFNRVQLNTHGEIHEYNQEFTRFLPSGIEYIFQYDGVNPGGPLRQAFERGITCSGLFDLSPVAGCC